MRAIVRDRLGATLKARICDECLPQRAHAIVGTGHEDDEWYLDWDDYEPVSWDAFALRRKTGWKPGDGTGGAAVSNLSTMILDSWLPHHIAERRSGEQACREAADDARDEPEFREASLALAELHAAAADVYERALKASPAGKDGK